MKTSTEELKRLAEAANKAYVGLPWQVTMTRPDGGTCYSIRGHSEPGIAVDRSDYWEDDHHPPVDHFGYIQPDYYMDCSPAKVDIARHIAAANPAAVLELIRQRGELVEALKDAREMVSDWAGYASPYFQEKHDIDGDLKKLDDAIARMEG